MTSRRNNLPLRSGYTTGACAAAAARAATIALLKQEAVNQVQVDLPDAKRVNFKVDLCAFNRSQASC